MLAIAGHRFVFLPPFLAAVNLLACGGSEAPGEVVSSGGTNATGGAPIGSGGLNGTGGVSSVSGGAPGDGGTALGSGGIASTGGARPGSGGTEGSGGAQTTGGSDGNGGAAPVGGSGSGGSGSGSGGTGHDEPCPSTATLTVGDTSMSLTVGGNEYPMNVHVPPAYDGQTRLPVVFDFHGLGGNENQMKNLSGWAATGDEHGFITVFPGGVDAAWNAGGCCSDTPTDVQFVREAIEHLGTVGCIDKKRIYASGCSNGGAMSYRLACEAADVIAAVAPVDFDCVVGGRCGSCNPGRPITQIQFRGTNDTLVDYAGAGPNFERWGEINECTGEAEPLAQNAACDRQPMCADGVESILCTVQGGTHCGAYGPFGISDLAWEIISEYSLP